MGLSSSHPEWGLFADLSEGLHGVGASQSCSTALSCMASVPHKPPAPMSSTQGTYMCDGPSVGDGRLRRGSGCGCSFGDASSRGRAEGSTCRTQNFVSWGLDLPFSTKPVGLRLLSAGFDPVSVVLVPSKSCQCSIPSLAEPLVPIPVSVGWRGGEM